MSTRESISRNKICMSYRIHGSWKFGNGSKMDPSPNDELGEYDHLIYSSECVKTDLCVCFIMARFTRTCTERTFVKEQRCACVCVSVEMGVFLTVWGADLSQWVFFPFFLSHSYTLFVFLPTCLEGFWALIHGFLFCPVFPIWCVCLYLFRSSPFPTTAAPCRTSSAADLHYCLNSTLGLRGDKTAPYSPIPSWDIMLCSFYFYLI